MALVDPLALGFDLEAIINFQVEPSALESVAARLVGTPAVRYLAATTGASDLTANAVFHDTNDLYDFRNRAVAEIPGVAGVQIDIVLEAVRREYHYPLFVPASDVRPRARDERPPRRRSGVAGVHPG